jgi:hypothetical protein
MLRVIAFVALGVVGAAVVGLYVSRPRPRRRTVEPPILHRDPGDETPSDPGASPAHLAGRCPRVFRHAALRLDDGSVFCRACEDAYGEGVFLAGAREAA